MANLDTTDSSQYCPSEFTSPRRTCGKLNPRYVSAIPWSGVFKSVWESDWLPVLTPYHDNRALTIDDGYVDCVSVTHGQSPREHVWTFAAANGEGAKTKGTCPCSHNSGTFTRTVPPFIGNNYVCDSGSRGPWSFRFYNDPLWNGQGCGATSSCCSFNNPPWFCRKLP